MPPFFIFYLQSFYIINQETNPVLILYQFFIRTNHQLTSLPPTSPNI
nr:MAG TPA: hypothetical protein [Caudoviricetes sp.]